jgi:hypothetical protein
VFAEFMDLGVAVVAARDAVVGACGLDLVVFELAVGQALLLESGLQKSPAPAAAIVVGAVGLHVDEVFLTHHRFHHKSQVFGNGIAVAFADDLAGVLDGELDAQVLVPVGVDLQFALADPCGIILVDILDFKIVLEVEFFQSGPD